MSYTAYIGWQFRHQRARSCPRTTHSGSWATGDPSTFAQALQHVSNGAPLCLRPGATKQPQLYMHVGRSVWTGWLSTCWAGSSGTPRSAPRSCAVLRLVKLYFSYTKRSIMREFRITTDKVTSSPASCRGFCSLYSSPAGACTSYEPPALMRK